MRKKNILVSILIVLIFLVTIFYILFSLKRQDTKLPPQEMPLFSQPEEVRSYQEDEESASLLEEVSEEVSSSLSGSVVEVIQGADSLSDMWIKVLSQQQNEEGDDILQKEYAFFLSAEITQGDKEIEGGDVVKIFYQGELSETDYVFVEKIEKIQ